MPLTSTTTLHGDDHDISPAAESARPPKIAAQSYTQAECITAEEAAQLRYEAGMYQALYENLKAQSPPRCNDWQQIDTAPKDGTPILAANSRHYHAPVVVRWDAENREGAEPHWCDAATREGIALYFNPNYFDLWQSVPLVPRDTQQGAAE